MSSEALTARVRAETGQVVRQVEMLTGLSSRWSGNLVLDTTIIAYGIKPFRCDIHLRADLADDSIRWRTLIHEALHSVSAGYNSSDYRRYKGWEEGVVEQTQRLLRPYVLANLKISVDVDLFAAVEAHNCFNAYIDALEEVRQILHQRGGLPFYLRLLETPIADRPAMLMHQVLNDPNRLSALKVVSKASAVLNNRINVE